MACNKRFAHWTKEEEDILFESIRAGKKRAEISVLLGRSVTSISSRMDRNKGVNKRLWTTTEKNKFYLEFKAGVPFREMKTNRSVGELIERAEIYGWTR